MTLMKATIEVLVETDDYGEACDLLSETLRPHLREYANEPSDLLDWRYAGDGGWDKTDGSGFELAATRFEPEDITTHEVREVREAEECSLMDAKRRVQTRKLEKAFQKLRAQGTLEDKVEWLLNRFETTIGRYQ